MFSKAKIAQLKTKFSSIDTNDINDSGLRAKAAKLKAKQGGFTLLELLVVVAILAAIAGTATIALQDTDARASAAAHVAMMDELNKGIRTFRVLNKNVLPTNFDSLIQTTSVDDASTGAARLTVSAIEDVALIDLTAGAAEVLNGGGINSLRYVSTDASFAPEGGVTCAVLEDVIGSRANAVVAGNIFLSPAANGCGYSFPIADQDAADGFQFTALPKVAIWTGGFERVLGQAGQALDVTAITTDGSALTAATVNAPILMAVGLGPSSSLFNANDLGGLTSVPVYRHVSATQYNRFVALFNIGQATSATAWTAADQVVLTAIVDGAGDTKEEELGEWDGTRNTI
jgi:prepilin-type N-terminal cleavage/methylation domain-containing protein